MTLEEAEFRVKQEMMPSFQDEIKKTFYAEQLGTVGVTYFGRYRPGEGKSDRELFERAFHAKDPSRKQALYELLIEDYPESELVEDSLFMLGDLAFEGLQDIRLAEKYFRRLLTEFPDSEYADDARYILDNLHNPRLRTPTSSEELQR
jgi:TolA-binding protein